MTRAFDFTAEFTVGGETYEGEGNSPWDAWRDLLAAMNDCGEYDTPEDPADCDWTGPDGNPVVVERINAWAVDGEDYGPETPADDDTPAEPGALDDDTMHDDAWHDGYYDGWYAAMAHARELAEAAYEDLNTELCDTSPPDREDR